VVLHYCGTHHDMNALAQSILDQLASVARQREQRSRNAALGAQAQAIKHWQHERFQSTYDDLLRGGRYASAARFFLDELYGPFDFSQRDAQFARVVPTLVRLFPLDVCLTVQTLSELHALSEDLDTAMAAALATKEVNDATYAEAWRAIDRPHDRSRQIRLLRGVGDSLDVYTRKPWLRHSLKLMRGPARAAGMAELQRFLELGFDTFRELGGAQDFLDIVVSREAAFAERLDAG
jgi:hypothetical protein